MYMSLCYSQVGTLIVSNKYYTVAISSTNFLEGYLAGQEVELGWG